jgi:hypothetical protein
MSPRRLSVSLLVLMLFGAPVGECLWSQDKNEDFWQLVQTVQDIFAGKNLEHAKAIISKGASFVKEDRLESLSEALTGRIHQRA